MNVHVTQAANGLPRRAFTVSEIERMVEAGIIHEHERFELIGGEVVPMSPKGVVHERLKDWLNYKLVRELPDGFRAVPETTLRLNEDSFVEPDFVVYREETGIEGLAPDTVLLAIEISVSSLDYDLGRKASVLAAFGVAELWVIDVADMQVVVHRKPTPTGYRDVRRLEPAERLKPLNIPDFTLTLADYR